MRLVGVVVLLCSCDEVFSIDRVPDAPSAMACAEDFCIDRTEVTKTQYLAFVEAAPAKQHEACAGNDITPVSGWPPAPGDELPITQVDWCDAWAYCAWDGKRLCGKIGGGALAGSARGMVATDQWYFACTGGIQDKRYPYGDVHEPGRCNDGMPQGSLAPVTAHPQCEGGLAGLLDMTGNAFEWVDTCTSAAADADCDLRGGSFYMSPDVVTCGFYTSLQKTRNAYSDHLTSFRCCLDR